MKTPNIIEEAIEDARAFMEKRTDCFYSDINLKTKSKKISNINKEHLYYNTFADELRKNNFKIWT